MGIQLYPWAQPLLPCPPPGLHTCEAVHNVFGLFELLLNLCVFIGPALDYRETETRAMVDKTKTFIIAANTGKERTGTITFILGDLPATTVTVKQLAGGEISSNEEQVIFWTVAKVSAFWVESG